jgi:hypothetical protein
MRLASPAASSTAPAGTETDLSDAMWQSSEAGIIGTPGLDSQKTGLMARIYPWRVTSQRLRSVVAAGPGGPRHADAALQHQ